MKPKNIRCNTFINDSIKKVRQQAKNQFAKIKYDFKKEKDENIELKAQKLIQHQEQKKKLTTLFYNDNCFGIALFIYYLSVKKTKEKKLNLLRYRST
jgi:hypothetical protein